MVSFHLIGSCGSLVFLSSLRFLCIPDHRTHRGLAGKGGNMYHRQNRRLHRRDILVLYPKGMNHLAFLVKFHADMCEDAKGCIFSCPWLKAVSLFSSVDADLV